MSGRCGTSQCAWCGSGNKSQSCGSKCQCGSGPGHKTPLDAMKNGKRETILYVPVITPANRYDYLATVDADPESPNYGKVVHRLKMHHLDDELHHTGWNACSSCHGDSSKKRSHMIMPSISSSRIYIVDMTSPLEPKIAKKIETSEYKQFDLSTPHTSHCLGSGDIMISCMGNAKDDGKCQFLLLDSNFEVNDVWAPEDINANMNYDFWYQPKFDVMISTEWGHPWAFKSGFNPEHVASGYYGKSLNVFSWKSKKMTQKIDLGDNGLIPLEVRFLHDPNMAEGFVGCALSSTIHRFYMDDDHQWKSEVVITIPPKEVEGWAMKTMPGLITDILISLDDRYLYFCNWLHGDIRQYDITNTRRPRFVGQIFLGGSICKGGNVKVTEDHELSEQPDPVFIGGRKIEAGPQMIQLSLDGKRLFVSNSLFLAWDQQMYPDLVKNGGHILQIDVDNVNGGLSLNRDFFVDFGDEPEGPGLAHEIRYPGGDCTSDIWLAMDQANQARL